MPEVIVETANQIAVLTLNRPDRLNAVNQALRQQLIAALDAVNRDDGIRAVIITGAGNRAFCAGQDLDEASDVDWTRIVPWLNAQRDMYQAVRNLDKPCVAALNGVTAGAGFQIALCSDWRIIAPETKIGQPEVKAGLASIVGSYLMTLHIGMTHNVQLSMSGELITGQRAHEIGLVTDLAGKAQVMVAALRRAHALAALPATAVRLSRQRFRAMTQAHFDEACVAGIRAQLECYAQGEPQQAMNRFIEARNKDKESA